MMMGPSNRTITGSLTLERLCTVLANLTDRPFVDLTELKGTYAFNLTWTPDENEKWAENWRPQSPSMAVRTLRHPGQTALHPMAPAIPDRL